LIFIPISRILALAGLVLLIITTLIFNSTLALAQRSPSVGSNSSTGSSAVSTPSPTVLPDSKLDKISSLSNIIGASMVNGIQVSAINIGDTDLTVTLKRQITNTSNTTSTTTTPTTNSNVSNSTSSLPVTVIAAKLPITNLTEMLSAIESSGGLAMASGSSTTTTNSIDTATGQTGSNMATIQGNAPQILALLKRIQIGAGSIVNANWTMPQTVSMGFIGLGNRIAASAPSYFVLVVVVPFQSESNIPTTLQMG
jgi:hypothetical protein